jgi:replication factor C small subunit
LAAKKLWTEFYRPKSLSEYVFQNEKQQEQLLSFVANHDIPHLLLTGVPGSGKTTVAEILINELNVDDCDILRENASNKTGIDYIRDIIANFAESYPLGAFKIIKLEEFDRVTPHAQDMLKAVIEESSATCRFICTANNENRIVPAIKSRFQHMRFKAPVRDKTFERMCEILLAEEVDFDGGVLDKYVSQAYPDIRKIINNLQLNTINGKLTEPHLDSDGGDYLFKLVDLVLEGNIPEIRKVVSTQCSPEQLEEIYEFLYKNLHKHPKLIDNAYEQALLILNEAIYKNSMVAIPHLNFECMCIKLEQLIS